MNFGPRKIGINYGLPARSFYVCSHPVLNGPRSAKYDDSAKYDKNSFLGVIFDHGWVFIEKLMKLNLEKIGPHLMWRLAAHISCFTPKLR